jgi:hypothetical protein
MAKGKKKQLSKSEEEQRKALMAMTKEELVDMLLLSWNVKQEMLYGDIDQEDWEE